MQNRSNLKAKLDRVSKEDFDQWASLHISRLFFGEFLDEIDDIVRDRKVDLPVDTMSDSDIAVQMRALTVVEHFIDSMREANNYETFMNTFDLGEEEVHED